MPLSPDDIRERTFGSSRKGYDENEVDDFLDEIYEEFVRLHREREELGGMLHQAQQSLAACQQELQVRRTAVQEAEAAAAAAPANQAPTGDTAAGILALAHRTADEHVTDARARADAMLAEAQAQASDTVVNAERRQQHILGELEQQRAVLERRVNELRAFEREYRSRLRAYLEGQLRDLDTRGSEPDPGSPAGAPSGQGAAGAGPGGRTDLGGGTTDLTSGEVTRSSAGSTSLGDERRH